MTKQGTIKALFSIYNEIQVEIKMTENEKAKEYLASLANSLEFCKNNLDMLDYYQ